MVVRDHDPDIGSAGRDGVDQLDVAGGVAEAVAGDVEDDQHRRLWLQAPGFRQSAESPEPEARVTCNR